MTPPLQGIVVVGLEQAIAAPFATRQLADLGATVIKIERPGGDFARHYDSVVRGESAFFVWANRGKQSVELDLHEDEDRAVLWSLVAGADVFIHNLSPDAADRLGVTAAMLHERYPGLIAAEVSGYGKGGPRSGDKAYDLAIQAEAGAFSVTGDEEMSKVGLSIADISAGMYAMSSILAALVRRERTGEGAAIHVAMLDTLVEWMSGPLYATAYQGFQAPRTGRRHHAIAPYGTFRLSDGGTILIAIQNDAEWCAFAELMLGDSGLGIDERFSTNSARIAHVEEVESLVRGAFGSTPAAQVRARLNDARIAYADVNDLTGVWQHDQLRERDRFVTVPSPSGDLELLKSPFDISEFEQPVQGIPDVGQHDRVLLDEVVGRQRPAGQ